MDCVGPSTTVHRCCCSATLLSAKRSLTVAASVMFQRNGVSVTAVADRLPRLSHTATGCSCSGTVTLACGLLLSQIRSSTC